MTQLHLKVSTHRRGAALWCWRQALCSEPAEAARRAPRDNGAPPFCVLNIGPRGIPLPQLCRFYDYDDCLQAAAYLRGNCVINIDYRGPITTDPRTLPPRRSKPQGGW